MTTTATAILDRDADRRLRRRLGGARRRPDRRLTTPRTGSSTCTPHAEPVHGREAIRETFAGLLTVFPDLTFVEQELISGEWGWVVRWTMSGTLAAALPRRQQGRRARLAVRDRRDRHDHGRRRQADRQAHLPRLAGGARPAGAFVMHRDEQRHRDANRRRVGRGLRRRLARADRRRQLLRPLRRAARRRHPADPAAAARDRSGKQAFREEFARPLFDLLHEVRGTVGSWASRDGGRRRGRLHRARDPRQARRRAARDAAARPTRSRSATASRSSGSRTSTRSSCSAGCS